MASAFKCDRCGSFSTGRPKLRLEFESTSLSMKLPVSQHQVTEGELELCEECCRFFKIFVEGQELLSAGLRSTR